MWAHQLFDALLKEPRTVSDNVRMFEANRNVGMIGHARWTIPVFHNMYHNHDFIHATKHVCKRFSIDIHDVGKKISERIWMATKIDRTTVHSYVELYPELCTQGRKKREQIISYFDTKGKEELHIPSSNFINTHFREYDIFVAGTIFMARYCVFADFFSRNDIVKMYDDMEEGYYEYNGKQLKAHAWERIFGIIVARHSVGCGNEKMRVIGTVPY